MDQPLRQHRKHRLCHQCRLPLRQFQQECAMTTSSPLFTLRILISINDVSGSQLDQTTWKPCVYQTIPATRIRSAPRRVASALTTALIHKESSKLALPFVIANGLACVLKSKNFYAPTTTMPGPFVQKRATPATYQRARLLLQRQPQFQPTMELPSFATTTSSRHS